MKSCMAWDRPKIYVEETNDAKLGRDAVDVTNTSLRKMLHRVFKADSGKKYRTAATVKTFLQRCVQKHSADLRKCFGYLEIGECLLRFFEEVAAEKLNWQSQELSVGTLSLAAASRAAALHRAQETLEVTHKVLEGLKVSEIMQAIRQENIYTGLLNCKSVTCWLNAAWQLLYRSAFLPEWLHYAETVERGALQRPFPVSHLKQLNSWMGKYEVVAPFELLHFVLDHWQNYGFIDQQCDSAEFIDVMHQLSNAPVSTEKVHVCFNHEPLQHKDFRHGPRCSLQEMVDLMLKDFPSGFERDSEEVLLHRGPHTVDEITGDLRWMECKIDDWNVEVDLAKYFSDASAVPMGCVAEILFVFF